MRRRWLGATAAAVLTAGLLASCSLPATPGPDPEWVAVPLPGNSWPSSLAAAGEEILVGGFDPGDNAPVLFRLTREDGAAHLHLAPVQPYAAVADLVAISPSDGTMVALGVARGGAHSNERWTTWDGPLDGQIRDYEQDFWTFGGHEAGPLIGVVRPSGAPVIVGSRASESGLDAALWTSQGTDWTRQPTTDPQLRSGPDRVLSFLAAASTGDTIVIGGDELGLAGGLLQTPVLWLGSVSGPWRTLHLPVPDQATGGTGPAQASAVACPASGDAPCWAAGWVRGRPVVWEVDASATTADATVLPGSGGTGNHPTMSVGLVGTVPVVLTNADEPLLAWRCNGSWRTAPAPPGTAGAVAAVGSRLYAVISTDAGRQLWRTEIDTSGC